MTGLHIVPGATIPAGALISPSGIQPDAYTPTVLSYTFKIEQQIAPNTSLGIGYVGSHGYHEMLSVDVNEPFPTVCPAAPCPASLAAGTVYYPKGAPLANPNVTNTTTWLSEGVSSYNGLEVDFNQRFSHGFQLRGVYTFSKNLDDGTALNTSVGVNAPAFVMFPLNTRLDWGRASTDVRNLASINGIVRPSVRQRKNGLAGEADQRVDLERNWHACSRASRLRRNWDSIHRTTETAATRCGLPGIHRSPGQ